MSANPLLIGVKQWHNSDIVFEEKIETSRVVAEGKAHMLYIERIAHQVCVIEVSDNPADEKLNCVLKITRTCKCDNLQRKFLYEQGKSHLECPYCGLNYGQVEPINPDDKQPEEFDNEEQEETSAELAVA